MDNAWSCDECGVYGKYLRPGPVLLNAVWLAISKRPEEFLCGVCVQQRCRERLGRELSVKDLRGCDANAWRDGNSWFDELSARPHRHA